MFLPHLLIECCLWALRVRERFLSRDNDTPVLAVTLAAEQPSPQSLRRLEHEGSRGAEPLPSLMASGQIHRADRIRVTHREGSRFLKFMREAEALEAWELRCALLRRSV